MGRHKGRGTVPPLGRAERTACGCQTAEARQTDARQTDARKFPAWLACMHPPSPVQDPGVMECVAVGLVVASSI